ncbi:MAG: hypothetical protein ACI9FJ_001932 [Alteromonadaceae bacterium]|jgi:hypothetical protein
MTGVAVTNCAEAFVRLGVTFYEMATPFSGNTFLKLEVSNAKGQESIKTMLKHMQTALENEAKLRSAVTDSELMPPVTLQANIGKIIQIIHGHGIPIIKVLSSS